MYIPLHQIPQSVGVACPPPCLYVLLLGVHGGCSEGVVPPEWEEGEGVHGSLDSLDRWEGEEVVDALFS